jgi:hypothetical protein
MVRTSNKKELHGATKPKNQQQPSIITYGINDKNTIGNYWTLRDKRYSNRMHCEASILAIGILERETME